MESYWASFIRFVKSSVTEKFEAFFPGMCFGLIGSLNILWAGVSISLVTFIFKLLGTVLMTGASALTTSYIRYRFEKYKNKSHVQQSQKRKRKGGGTAA
jgi:membrane protein implicated in regulation of membrane protease activity